MLFCRGAPVIGADAGVSCGGLFRVPAGLFLVWLPVCHFPGVVFVACIDLLGVFHLVFNFQFRDAFFRFNMDFFDGPFSVSVELGYVFGHFFL